MSDAVSPEEFEVRVIGPPRSTMRVVVRGELDMARTEAVERAFAQIDGQPVEAVVLDLRPVGFIDSSGLRCILRLRSQVDEHGVRFTVVCQRNGPVHDVMRMTGLEEVLQPIFEGDQANPADA
jgi:anti-sigma B factor antagonist